MRSNILNFLFIVTFFFGTIIEIEGRRNIVCYLGSWSAYRYGNGKFTVEDIDPNLCTHIVYGFVGINENGTVRIMDQYLEVDSGNLRRFVSLKEKNPSLKVLVAVGGWNEGSVKFSHVAADPQLRSVFRKSAVELLGTYGFDGLDLDWEYPAQRGGSSADKRNFVLLLEEFREEFRKHNYLLTAAVSAAGSSVDVSYDVPALSRNLDIINIMAYDFHGAWDTVTGENAPLYASNYDLNKQQTSLNVDSAIRGWIRRGANPEKISLGLAAYGRSFTLSDVNNNGIGAPISSAGNPAKYTGEAGMLGFNEICELLLTKEWTVKWNEEQRVPYMFKGNQWVGYDDPKSISIKAQYAVSLGLGGVMLWSIETEDFLGLCGEDYPLLKAVNAIFNGTSNGEKFPENPTTKENKSKTQTLAPEPLTQQTPHVPNSEEEHTSEKLTTEERKSSIRPTLPESQSRQTPTASDSVGPVNPASLCKEVGYIRDPSDCAVFYYCLEVGNTWVPLRQECAGGLVFDKNLSLCNYPELVDC